MGNSNTSYYSNYIHNLRNENDLFNYANDIKNSGLLEKNHFFNLVPGVIFLLDYRTGKYLYTNHSSRGLFAPIIEDVLDKGCELFISYLHPKDYEYFTNVMFKRMCVFLQSHPNIDYRNIRFSFNVRFRRIDGSYFNMLQQSTIIECDLNNRPLLNLGITSDVSHLKSNTTTNFSINSLVTGELISSDHFAQSDILTKREKEILDKIILGMNSSQIAEHYFISEQTVKIHRKNMLEKATAKNMPEMIRLATVNGWI